MAASQRRPDAKELVKGLRAGDRATLSRAITLVESTREADRALAQTLLDDLHADAPSAARIGITGVPGAGKSTFIDALGTRLVEAGRRVAVLAVDPSSEATGGSILGDKTRMERLSRNANAYVRPSPAGHGAGGVAPRTREAMLLCEAAGFDTVLIETVGTGQSELGVAHMVDTFVLLALAGAGDELQGIKRGVMELADVLVLHKIDLADRALVEQARTDFMVSQRLVRQPGAWAPPIAACSSLTGDGIDGVWEAIETHREHLGPDGIRQKRQDQALQWFDHCVLDLVKRDFFGNAGVAAALAELRDEVHDGRRQPAAAAAELMRRRS